MTITVQKAIDAMRALQCTLLGGDYPALDDMSLFEIEYPGAAGEEPSSIAYFYSGTQIRNWIDTNQSKDRVCNNPNTNIAFVGTPEIKPAKQLFTLTLAAVIQAGHLEALKQDDAFLSFLETKDYKEALEAGNKILESLKTASGQTLREKLITLNLSEIKGTPGEMRFLEGVLGLNLNELSVDQKAEDEAVLLAILKFTPPAQPVSIEDQRNWADRIIAEINAPDYVGKGFPLGRGIQNRHEQKTMQFVQHISDPELLAELLERVLAIATVNKNVACLSDALQTKLLTAYLEMNERNIELIYRGINALARVLKQVPEWSSINPNSLRPYLQCMEQFFSVVEDSKKWAELFVNLHELKTEMLKRHEVFPDADPKKQILPGKTKAVDVVMKNGELAEKSKMQGFIDFTGERIGFVYRTRMKTLSPELLNEIGPKLLEIGDHEKDNTVTYSHALVSQYIQTQPAVAIHMPVERVSEPKNFACESIMQFIEELRKGMLSGDKEAVENTTMIDMYARDPSTKFNEQELTGILTQFNALKVLCDSPEMQLAREEVQNAITPCMDFFDNKLKAIK